jgi:glycosyltransferase involved in cell wall biosynthesis
MTMRVAALMASGDLGGAERSLLALIASAGAASRVTLLLPAGGDLQDAAAAAGVEARVVPWPARLLALGERGGAPGLTTLAAVMPAIRAAAARVRAEVVALRPDALVTNGVKPHVVGTLAARGLARLPLVWYLRESLEGRRVAGATLRALSSRCDGAVAISRYVAADAARYLRGGSPDVIYNIVSDAAPSHGSGQARDQRDRSGDICFASVGALTPLKGHDIFISAAASVRRQYPRARFLIAGGNRFAPERGRDDAGVLRRLAASLHLEDAVEFLGHHADVPRLLTEVDVLVQSNTGPEGFGRSVAEAMQAGVPVIASGRWSFLELIEDGQTGWLVPPGDAAALATRMVAVAQDAPARRAVAARAQAFIARAIQPAACVAAFESTLRRAAARREPPARPADAARRMSAS